MIFILHGKDAFRKQLKLSELKAKYLDPGMEALNLVQVTSPSLMDFISTIKTPAMGFGSKLIIVKNFKYLETKSGDDEVAQIIAALSTLPESVVLIIDNEKISGTIKLSKQIKKNLESQVEYVDFTPFNSWDTKKAAAWVAQSYSSLREDSKIDISTAEHFVEQVGSEDTSKLYSELKRLITLSDKFDKHLIDQECQARHDIFNFIRFLAEENLSKANSELEKIISAKDLHLGLVSIMQTSLSRYLKLKLAEKKRLAKNQMAELLGISPGRLYYQQQEARRMKLEHLEAMLERTLDCERNVKTGRMPIERAMRVLVNS